MPPNLTERSAVRRWRELRKIAFSEAQNPDRHVAAQCWERVIEIKPADEVARYALARTYLLLHEPLQALSHLEAIPASARNFERARQLRIRIAGREIKRIEGRITPHNVEDFSALLSAAEPVLGDDPRLMRIQSFVNLATGESEVGPAQAGNLVRAKRAAAKKPASAAASQEAEALELADQLDSLAPDTSEPHTAELRHKIVRLLPGHPELVRRFVQRCEQLDRKAEALEFLRSISPHALAAKVWLEAAQFAGRSNAGLTVRDFCERAFARAGFTPAAAARVSSILLKSGLHEDAVELWERVPEEKNTLLGHLGLVRSLAQSRRHAELFSRGLRILESVGRPEHLDPADQARLVEIARRTASGAQALFCGAGAFPHSVFPETDEQDSWTDWLRALFARARDDSAAALFFLERSRDGKPWPIATLDGDAEAGLVHAQSRRYGDAFIAFSRANPQALSSDSAYRRRYSEVKSVVEFCGGSGPLNHPEALIDVVLEEAAQRPLRYEPRPRSLLTVCGSLGQGGGERQTITILHRLTKERAISDVMLAVRSTDGPGRDFFLPQLREIPLEPIIYGTEWRKKSLVDDSFAGRFASERMKQAFELLPYSVREDILRLCRVIFQTRPAAVHIRQDMHAGAIACAIAGVPRVVVHRGSLSPDKWAYEPFREDTRVRPMRHIYRRLLETAPLRMVNNSAAGSASDRAWLEWADESRFRVIYNAVEFGSWPANGATAGEMRLKLGIGQHDFVVGGVFRLQPVKRPMLWIEVAARIAQRCPGAHFIVLGDGEVAPAMQEYASRHGFRERLHMPGQVQDVGSWYPAMDLNLLTSEREGLPNVLIEGQHFGVPALAPDVGGVKETLEPGATGRMLSPEAEADHFAEAAVEIWNDSEWRAKVRQRAPSFVHEKFGHDRAVEALLECFGF